MNGDRPTTWALSFLTAAAAMLLLALGSPSAAADPQPGPTSIRVQAQLATDFTVTASGLLTDRDGRAVANAAVQARVDGTPVADTITRADGTYQLSFTLGDDLRVGQQHLVVVFGGRDGLGASQADTIIPAAGTPATGVASSAPPESPAAPPPPTRPAVTFKISLAPTLVPLGGLVMVEGILSGADGTPIPDARIVVRLDGKESADSLVFTGPEGTFQTFAEIPGDQPAGKADLVVVFAGNGAYAPGEKAVTVTVEELPLAEDTQGSAGATGSVSAEPAATNTTTPTAASTADTGTTTDTAGGRSPLSWFYVALIVVGGAALVVAAALAFRTMYGQRDATRRDTGGLERLLDVDPEADADGDGLLGASFAEEDLQSAPDGQSAGQPPQAEPGEDLRPRRSAD